MPHTLDQTAYTMSSYPPTNTFNNVQPALQENPYVQKQPMTQPSMDAQQVPAGSNQEDEQVMRLRGGCPGHFCGLRESSTLSPSE
ncbi:hypothetical protein, variant 2 [Cryptococcus amylolentus CBS 6039]|uniref:Uncharacterized protein n=1 Tax=Cryptococcus amylolentus CBS 6039 TaxID=1295533 RepID=A0A1E3HHJ7_9TREE|nr:hypothetical protein, variant 2 [Cryptococcus amylolentus CBS 6039]ODN75819.1 hypothetical protein, variant 2 [Cryptococcus amylolentus CBS 6039]